MNVPIQGIRSDNRYFALLMLLSSYIAFVILQNLRLYAVGTAAALENFVQIFLSILIEAIPFILLGVFVSSLIQLFVSEAFIQKILPHNRLGALIAAALSGLVFPVCECGVIPVARRLNMKGVPNSAVVTFMLAVPIINPVVIASTAYAFSGRPEFVLLRIGLGFMIAVAAGLAAHYLLGEERYTRDNAKLLVHNAGCPCCTTDRTNPRRGRSRLDISGDVVQHAIHEFFDVGRYLVIGAFLAAAYQVFVPRNILFTAASGPLLAILAMMAFAFLLSLCSEADAFIAATFLGSLSTPAILAFLLLGPMLDVKNTLMLAGSFKPRFVMVIIPVIIVLVAAASIMVHIFMG